MRLRLRLCRRRLRFCPCIFLCPRSLRRNDADAVLRDRHVVGIERAVDRFQKLSRIQRIIAHAANRHALALQCAARQAPEVAAAKLRCQIDQVPGREVAQRFFIKNSGDRQQLRQILRRKALPRQLPQKLLLHLGVPSATATIACPSA